MLPAVIDQSWVAEWTAVVPWERNEEGVLWLQSRPASIQRLMLRFPPMCVVRATRPLRIPALGTVGIVATLVEPSERNPDGLVGVLQSPDADVRGHCEPSCLEVVGYHRGLTREVISAILAEPRR